MCLEQVDATRYDGGDREWVISGYKVMISPTTESGYMSLFNSATAPLVTGVWYWRQCNRANFYNTHTNRWVSKTGKYKDIIARLLNENYVDSHIFPYPFSPYLIRYETGFHFFFNRDEAQGHLYRIRQHYHSCHMVLVRCKFRQLVAVGSQWGYHCGVAREMKIIKEM